MRPLQIACSVNILVRVYWCTWVHILVGFTELLCHTIGTCSSHRCWRADVQPVCIDLTPTAVGESSGCSTLPLVIYVVHHFHFKHCMWILICISLVNNDDNFLYVYCFFVECVFKVFATISMRLSFLLNWLLWIQYMYYECLLSLCNPSTLWWRNQGPIREVDSPM